MMRDRSESTQPRMNVTNIADAVCQVLIDYAAQTSSQRNAS